MNKLIVTIVSMLLLTASSVVLAQDLSKGPGKKSQRQHGGMQAMPTVEQLTKAVRHLELSEEQKTGIHTVLKGLRTEVQPLMKEMKAGQAQLRELAWADSYDEQAVAAIAANEGNLATERVKLTSRAIADILGQLTPEQRAELAAMAAERKARRAGKRQHAPKP